MMKAKKKKTRLGLVSFKSEYVVDLNDKEMVDHAKEAVCEDIDVAVKSVNMYEWIQVTKAPAGTKESDIPTFLLPEENQ
jgi:hypothetical protein